MSGVASRLLLLSFLSVASALQWAPRMMRGTALRPLRMMEAELPKPGTMGPEHPPPMLDEDGNEVVDDEWESQENEEEKLVPMSTPLGNDVDLSPLPGPEVPVYDESNTETRPAFALFSVYQPQQVPSEALQREYTKWLASGTAAGTTVCHAFYLVAPSATGEALAAAEEANSITLTDDELDALDRARLEDFPQDASPDGVPDAFPDASRDGTQDTSSDTSGSTPGELAEGSMLLQAAPYVLGNLNVIRAESRAMAEAFAASDPCLCCGGYAETAVYEWGVEEAEELKMPRGDGPAFVIFARDAPSASSLRSASRDANLAWLVASKRVMLAGSLLDDTGAPVGSLVSVKGVEQGEVAEWAEGDPYQQAGVFGKVVVAMAPEVAVEEAAPLFSW